MARELRQSLRGEKNPLPRSPSARCPFTVSFLGEGSPTKIDYRKKMVPTYSSLSTGGPRLPRSPVAFIVQLL